MRPARLVPGRLFIVLLLALAGAGCARAPFPLLAAATPVAAPPPAAGRPDLDTLMYANGPSPRLAPAMVAPAPGPVVAVPVAVPVALPAPDMGAAYTLDAGDRLRIVVFGQEGLSNSYLVDAAGNITMPLIGAVPARGCTTAELTRTIVARLRNGFIREPHVAIEVEAYRPFFILGEVTYPGQYPYVPNMTIETAVAIAGGFTPRAYHWDVRLSRTVAGQTYVVGVPLIYSVRPGDTITIKERWF